MVGIHEAADMIERAAEQERQRCLDIVVGERRVWRSAGALTTLDMVALKIKEGVKA